MLAEQLPTIVQMPVRTLLKPPLVRSRSVRRPFMPPAGVSGSYTLPKGIQDRLAAALAPFRNREAAFALAVFLARYWSAPARLGTAFPIDRRALAERALTLELTEARVRGAARTLELIGFLDRAPPISGSRYRATMEGLHRRPILWRFGADFAPAFLAANRRAQAAQDGRLANVRPQTAVSGSRPSESILAQHSANSPKSRSEARSQVLMGDVRRGCRQSSTPVPIAQDPALEVALEKLRIGMLGS